MYTKMKELQLLQLYTRIPKRSGLKKATHTNCSIWLSSILELLEL